MPESLHTRLERWYMNFFPAYRGTGAWVTYIASDWREVRVKLPLSWQTRNVVGVTFGGSLYAAVDPIYMLMLMHNLGDEYLVWDKSATIRFKRPGRSSLYAHFRLGQDELDAIRAELLEQPSLDRVYAIEMKDKDGELHALIEKTIYISRRPEPLGGSAQ